MAALALPGVVAFDLAVAGQIFGFRDEAERYAFTVCAPSPGPVPTSTGFAVTATAGLEALILADTVIVPGFYPVVEPDPPVLAALRSAHAHGARIASVCIGAFALAAAGLLDGRRATTHWREADELRRRYPLVRVDTDVLFIDGGQILTSAGQSASIDFYLHLVRRDFGSRVADAVARRMVITADRSGDHPQDVRAGGRAAAAAADALTRTMEWAIATIHRPLTLAQMARHADMPARTFTRRFRARTHLAPMQWLTWQRVLEAQYLLESTDLSVEDVADRAGLGSPGSLRAHLMRSLGATPTDYRRTHRHQGRARVGPRLE